MDNSTRQYSERGIGRRREDRSIRDRNYQFERLFNVGQTITSEMNMESLFEIIMDQTNQILGTKRSTVFLFDDMNDELWSMVATGMDRDKIRIQSHSGVAGRVFQSRTPLIINDAYNDPHFYSEVDKRSGFRTKNILCIPIINRQRVCIGVLQALNKDSGDFTEEDTRILESISHYVAIGLENSKLYKEVQDYSEELKETLVHIEMLERIKGQLTKFVPSSVAKMAEKNPDQLTHDKIPMDVTILFIDIQGFSRITEGFDQKLVNDMVESHFSRYLECLRRNDGEVNETSGDGLMVIFKEGLPETQAREAVTAGLEIITENNLLNDQFSYPWGRIQLHLGINSGRAHVGSTKMKSLTGDRWTYTASGLVTVLAARIGALSYESRLFIGQETYQFVKDHFLCEFLGEQKVKNVNDPVPVYWVKNE